MRQIIVNADDFGLSEAVNYGIIKAYEQGIVTSTTIMANMPAFEHAVSLAKNCPKLAIGVHLTLTAHKPLLMTHKTLVDQKGYFDRHKLATYNEEEAFQELCAQIDKVFATGLTVDHLDSHHHIHSLQVLKPLITRIVDKYKLPIRGGFEYPCKCSDVCALNVDFYEDGTTVETFKKIINEMKETDVYDIMCHPAYVDKYIMDTSSYTVKRVEELDVLTSEELKDFIKSENICLTTYGACFKSVDD